MILLKLENNLRIKTYKLQIEIILTWRPDMITRHTKGM